MPSARVTAGPAVSRRTVLGGLGGTASAAVLGGCSRTAPPVPVPGPEVAVLTAAIAAEQRLIALHEAVLRAHQGLAERLEPMLAHHRAHLEALRRHYVPGTGQTTAPAPAAWSATPGTVPDNRSRALASLRRAESEAAAARAQDAARMTAGMAQLLASIGACEAGHAAMLGEDG